MKNVLLIFATIFGTLYANAQSTSVVSGKISDLDSNLSLPGARITLNSDAKYTVSDQIGNFEFLDVPAGTYNLEVEYLGYPTYRQEITVRSGQNAVIDIPMTTRSQTLQEVLIVGDQLKGQAKALNQQKSNQNITNVISADQVGRFPDANIGDALKRVPGITMQNDQGEARNIIIRGLAPNLNSVTLNGDRIPSTEGDNRNVQMDLIPSDMISTIEVNKTLTPDMDGDAIGGSVNLITRASPNGERISATIAGGYNPIREKGNYTAGLVYGNRFFDNKLGAVLSYSFNSNNFGSDNVEASWNRAEDNDESVFIEEIDVRTYNVQRIRNSIDLNLDYEFDANNKIYASAMYNYRTDRENRFARLYEMEPILDDNNEISGFEGSLIRQLKGGIGNDKNKNTRLEIQKVQNYALGGEHLLSSKIDLDWSVNYAMASEEKPNERYIEFESEDATFTQDMRDSRRPFAKPLEDNLANYEVADISQSDGFSKESVFGAKINLRVPFSLIEDRKGRLRFGGRVNIKNKERDNNYFEYESIDGLGSLLDVPTRYFDGEKFQPGSHYHPGYFPAASFLGGLDLGNTSLFESELVPGEFISENYQAKESVFAAYVRWDQDLSDRLSMIVGARSETTNIDYTGNYVMEEEDVVGQISRTNSYTNILPSLAFKYDVSDDFIIRTAFTTGLARPNYYALVPYLNVISEDKEIYSGNSDLKVTYAYNFDLMVEKYFKSVGILSGGVFYKNLNDFIYTYTNRNYSSENFSNDYLGQSNPIPAGEDDWAYTQQRNGENVDLYGFEVALQRQLDFIPGKFWKGLGVYVNYTYTDSKAEGITNEDGEERTDVKLPGTAPHMFNSSLSWENNRFSARISLNYSSDYIAELGGSDFEDAFYDEQLFVDANASYKITNNMRIFIEANNLSNQPLRYYQGLASRTMQMEYYQPRYKLGFKFDF